MIELAELKEWLRVSSIDDDNKLNDLISASLGFISNYCNRLFFETVLDFENIRDTLSEREIENSVILDELPHFQQANIKNARIKLICDWYEYRGDTVEYTANKVPNGIKAILQPFWIYKITD